MRVENVAARRCRKHKADKNSDSSLTAELEALAVRALGKTYDDLNNIYFKNCLRRPVIGLSDTSNQLGRWVAETRALELARSLLYDCEWGVVVEVLKHEMAHQYVDEVLGSVEEPVHGPAFKRVCEERAIDFRAAGAPSAGKIGDEEKRVVERIAKLLALAESPNLYESQSAMNTAQKLMLKHNIDASKSQASRDYSFRHLGAPTGRVDETQRILAAIIGDHFFVETIWAPVWRPREGKRGSVLEVCGAEANLEMAEYVHAFLTETAERLWWEYRRERNIDCDRNRRSFTAGVMAGFREKLDRQRGESRGQGLVWVGDAMLHKYFRRRHPYVRTVRFASRGNAQARSHGRAAGRRIELSRAIKGGASGGVRLLPANNA